MTNPTPKNHNSDDSRSPVRDTTTPGLLGTLLDAWDLLQEILTGHRVLKKFFYPADSRPPAWQRLKRRQGISRLISS